MRAFPARVLSVAALALAAAMPASAGEFSVTPIRAELKPGALSETITVTNHAATPLRVSIRLMEWTQDQAGNDVYKESGDLVYFPRQMDVPPEGKRLVRVGAKSPAGVVERSYRLFIEEEPDTSSPGAGQVAFYFRFGVPIFLPPVTPRATPDVDPPVLADGTLKVQVRNAGNQHFKINKVTVSDGAGYGQDVVGWYMLPGARRTYVASIPGDVCRKARTLAVGIQGDGIQIDRTLNVDPASCR